MCQNLDLFEKIAQIVLPQTQLDLNTFSPEETLREAANYAYAAAARSSRSLTLELPPDLPQISADPRKLEQVLHILLDNAVGRTPEGGKIELRARTRERELMVEVIDRGPAFSTEEKKGLLEPYRPSEVDRLPFPELSLSLAICRKIIELHGGKLWLESKPGRETTFAFSLPLILVEE